MSEAGVRGAAGRVGSLINGKWQVDARLGSGGMATVYAATHRNGHRAALKMLHTTLSRDPSTRARFLREGYVANAVGHPGVVGVIDDGIAEDGAAFLVLELLEGETIDARRVRLGGALPIDEALELAEQSLDALAAAHEKGIIHRDIKPENVFYTKQGRIKLLDFGLARMKDTQLEATKTGVTIGTPEFMPPEQALGRRSEVDHRSDIWGLGATLFTAITGRYVHDDATSLHEQLVASATRRSRPIRQLAPHVSPAVANVIDKALELEMNDRWQSAREMQTALRAARGGKTGSGSVFTADSMTVPAASLPGTPFSHDKPLSSDKTMQMTEAPFTSAGVAAGVLGSGFGPPQGKDVYATAPGNRQHIEDATDMEATFIEAAHAPPTPQLSNTHRMRDGDRGALGLGPFRGAILTPSEEHATISQQAPPLTPQSGEPALSEYGPTVLSPRSFPADATIGMSPRSFPLDQPTLPRPFDPSEAHAETIASPRSFRPSNPPPAFVSVQLPSQQQHQQQHQHQHQQQHVLGGGGGAMSNVVPSNVPTGRHPKLQDSRSSARAVLYISLVLIVVCAAMGAWVLYNRANPTPR